MNQVLQNVRPSRRDVLKSTAAGLAALATGVHTSSATGAIDSEAAAKEWWTWRGPLGNNVAPAGSSAVTTYDKSRIAWAAPVPGRGHSSPIVAGDAVYLTTADKTAGLQSVLAYHRRTGKPLWNQVVHRGGIPAENHPKNTEASPSVAFDGERVIAAFYNSSAVWLSAISPTGKPLWQQKVSYFEPQQYKYGYAASPALYRDTVIVAGDFDGESFIAAHEAASGKQIWKTPRPNATSFSSPIVINIAGRDQLVLSGADAIRSYDPTNGKLLWSAEALTMATCGTVVWDGDLIFATGGYPKAETACVKADGSGEVVWTNTQKCYEQSMLAVDGHVYAVTDAGVAHCWRATDGELLWKERLGGLYSSSPLLVGDVIHVFNESGEGFAFKASPSGYQSVGGGKIADDVFATPAVVGDTMYMRLASNQNGQRQEFLIALK